MDFILLVGSGVGLLALWIVLSCLIMVLRDRFTHDGQMEPDPMLLPEFGPGGDEGYD